MPDTFNSTSLGTALQAATQSWPYIALLYQNPARTAESFTVDGSGFITLAAASIKTALAKRVTITTSATLPSQSVFFMVPHFLDPTKFSIALTAADAQAGFPLVTVAGSATGTVYDVSITADDEVSSLVSYEMSFAGYTRQFSPLGGPAYTSPPAAAKATIVGDTATFTNSSTSALECTHVLTLFGGSATPGDWANSFYGVTVNAGLTTIPASGTYDVTVTLEAING